MFSTWHLKLELGTLRVHTRQAVRSFFLSVLPHILIPIRLELNSATDSLHSNWELTSKYGSNNWPQDPWESIFSTQLFSHLLWYPLFCFLFLIHVISLIRSNQVVLQLYQIEAISTEAAASFSVWYQILAYARLSSAFYRYLRRWTQNLQLYFKAWQIFIEEERQSHQVPPNSTASWPIKHHDCLRLAQGPLPCAWISIQVLFTARKIRFFGQKERWRTPY